MTEAQFQATRQVMVRANSLRGCITESKGIVAKWTALEFEYRKWGKDKQADHAKKQLENAMGTLNAYKQSFSDLKLPPEDVPPNTRWIAALDSDSFNYEPKEIPEAKFNEAQLDGHMLHETKPRAQSECDQLNSL